ncbi:MAG: roadblock/LC7 domain-containing protein [Planctomycetes bacterium]|nr:roadblock/LC7 domain-containing protein [Planctomycetota bacterium]
MGKIQDVVGELRQVAGVKGVAVVTLDGLVIATALEEGTSPDVIGGLASYLLMTTNKSLAEGGLGGCTRLSLHATHGKAVFVDLTDSCLVVMVDQFVDPANVRREIDDAAQRIRRASRLS